VGIKIEFLILLEQDLHLVCKQKRTGKTSMEQLKEVVRQEREEVERNLSFLCV